MRKFIYIVLGAVFFLAESGYATSLLPWAAIDEKSAIRIVNRHDYTTDHFADGKPDKADDLVIIDFMGYASNEALKSERNDNVFSGVFTFPEKQAIFDFKGEIVVQSPEELEYRIFLNAPEETEIKESFFSLLFNRAMLDRELVFTINNNGKRYQKQLKIADDHKGGWIWSSPKEQLIEKVKIPMRHGELELSGFSQPAMVCKYGSLTGNLRIYLNSGKIKEIAGQMKIKFTPYHTVKLDLSQAANMGLADEAADDRKGGWTDQGPDNDMRKLPAGTAIYGNVPFEVINPANNNGKSILAFANQERSYFLREAVIDAENACFDWLYLFHAAAWSRGEKVGSIRIDYQGGKHDIFEVHNRRDVANWWGGVESFDNATLIWRSQNRSSLIGLYLSRFKIKKQSVERITFSTSGNTVWLVVAATGVSGEPPFPRGNTVEIPFVIAEGQDWKSFTFSKDRIPGSALDFSPFIEAPAGKYGRVRVHDNHFVFEQRPNQPIRFLGANICGDANYLEYAQTDRLVDRIVKSGYNAVRLHHFDNGLIKPGATSLEFVPERLDRLFYLIAKCKERGLYVSLDLYTSRVTGFNRKYKSMFDIKSRMMFSRELRDNLMEFSRILLTTVNPHTGLALKDDPVLMTIGLINEDPMTTHHEEYKYPNSDPKQNTMIKNAFESWCIRNGFAITTSPTKSIYLKFLLEHHVAVFNELKSSLTAIGVTTPLSDISCGTQFALTLPRQSFDYVDMHLYFDHPRFPVKAFSMPFENHNESAVKEGLQSILNAGALRISEKPFTVTEFNFCVPNQHRSEGGPIMGALAAMQEWDGIFRFQFIGYNYRWKIDPLANGGHLGSFSTANDPIQALSELIIHLFYLRGDVSPAGEMALLRIPPDVWRLPESSSYAIYAKREESNLPEVFTQFGLTRKVGLTVEKNNGADSLETVLKNKHYPDAPTGPVYVSSTGELTTDAKAGTFKAVTPKSEALVIPGKTLTGKSVKVTENTTFSTVFAGSLDNQPLEDSRRILLLHLTDVKATGQKWGIVGKRIRMYNWGNFSPYLVRRGSARITLKLRPGEYTVRALDIDGAVLHEVPTVNEKNSINFLAATDCGPDNVAVFAYEILKK